MKKSFFVLLLIITGNILWAQTSDRYVTTMENLVPSVDTSRSVETLTDLSGAFQRIGDAEKTQWLPYYYAALTQVSMGYQLSGGQMGGMADKLDPIADKSEELLNKAEALSKDNSEIYIVKKMIATLRLMADPMSRYMTYGPAAAEALETAKKLNPENPRVYLQEGLDKLFTPEQFGGSKTEAKALLEEALKKYDAAKPESSIHPSWGKGQVGYFLSQIN